jgi:dihydrofolate reductase
MRKIIVVNNLTLDGVMQAPGQSDEDPRDGFAHGGWAVPYNDAVMAKTLGEGNSKGADLLFGRRTYEQFFSVWPKRTNNPYTPILNQSQKYVASRTLTEPLPWQNSTLLAGNAAESVARLKAEPGKDVVVLGSGDLLQTLMRAGLVDQYILLIFPLLLGHGRRLFNDDGQRAALRLVNSVTTTTGVIIATYQPA